MPIIAKAPAIAPRASVPFGFAIWGIAHEVNHIKMEQGYPVQKWFPQECCFTYPTFYPALWGTRYWTPVERVRELSLQYPGRTWLLWNEPEPEFGFGPLPERDRGQACISPTNARDITIEWVEAIRAGGGKIAGWGCTVTTPSHWTEAAWRKWMEQALRLNFPQPDYWHIHIYSNTVSGWIEQYEIFQDWNLRMGGNLPVIISEAGGGIAIYSYLRSWVDPRVLAVMWFTRFDPAEDPYLTV